MLFNDIKALAEKTPQQIQAEKQATIQKGNQLSFERINTIIDNLYYQIECIKTKLRDKETPEEQKAILKTRLFYLETNLKKAKKKFSEIFIEEYGG